MQGEPAVVWMPGGVRTEIHLDGEATAGAFCLLVDRPPAGLSLPPHLHRGMAETMHILEGEFELTIEGERVWLAPGQTAHVPADAVHETDNVGTGTGRRVVMLSPAGMERFFLVVGAPSKEVAIDGATALSSALRHGWRFVS